DDVAVRTAHLMGRVAHAASLAALALALVGAGAVPPPPSGMPPAPPPPPAAPLPPAVAEPSVTLAERAAAIEAAAEEPDGERVVLGHLSRKLGMSAEALRAQRAQTGLGWGRSAHCQSPVPRDARAVRRPRRRGARRPGLGERRARARRRPRAAGERRAHLGRDRRTALRGPGTGCHHRRRLRTGTGPT